MEITILEGVITLLMLTLLQAVLGFDNLLYITIESRRVPEDKQSYVRRLGIGLAIGLRIVLLFVVIAAIGSFKAPFFSLNWAGIVEGSFNLHAIIVLIGGVFLIYTALKEITHMLSVEQIDVTGNGQARKSTGAAIFWIVLMNLVFSFDSILAAVALTDNFWIMAAAIVISGLMMIFLADTVADFLKRNRMYEVLGLFVLFIVGIMLLSEGGTLAQLRFFGFPVEQMSKTTFYFVIAILVVVDIAQSRYQKKLLAQKQREITAA